MPTPYTLDTTEATKLMLVSLCLWREERFFKEIIYAQAGIIKQKLFIIGQSRSSNSFSLPHEGGSACISFDGKGSNLRARPRCLGK